MEWSLWHTPYPLERTVVVVARGGWEKCRETGSRRLKGCYVDEKEWG